MKTDKRVVPVRDPHTGRFTRAIVPAVDARYSLARRLKVTLTLSDWPTRYAVALSLICGAVTVLNQTTFDFPTALKTAITWALAGFAFMGIGPVVGPKFAAAIKLPPKVAAGVSVLLLVGLTVAQEDVTLPYRAIIIGAVQVAGGLGFEPAYLPTI